MRAIQTRIPPTSRCCGRNCVDRPYGARRQRVSSTSRLDPRRASALAFDDHATSSIHRMRAAVITRPGGPEVLEIRDVDTPRVGADDVLVRVHASGLNRADIHQRKGGYPAPPGSPADIPGLEYAGEVADVGSRRDATSSSAIASSALPAAERMRSSLRSSADGSASSDELVVDGRRRDSRSVHHGARRARHAGATLARRARAHSRRRERRRARRRAGRTSRRRDSIRNLAHRGQDRACDAVRPRARRRRA